jgi:hypothetical protein
LEVRTKALCVFREVRPEYLSFSSAPEALRVVSSRSGIPRWTGDPGQEREDLSKIFIKTEIALENNIQYLGKVIFASVCLKTRQILNTCEW